MDPPPPHFPPASFDISLRAPYPRQLLAAPPLARRSPLVLSCAVRSLHPAVPRPQRGAGRGGRTGRTSPSLADHIDSFAGRVARRAVKRGHLLARLFSWHKTTPTLSLLSRPFQRGMKSWGGLGVQCDGRPHAGVGMGRRLGVVGRAVSSGRGCVARPTRHGSQLPHRGLSEVPRPHHDTSIDKDPTCPEVGLR